MTDRIPAILSDAEESLARAQVAFDGLQYDEAEQLAQAVVTRLTPLFEREDMGEETDSTSLKFKLIAILAHAFNRLNVIALARNNPDEAIRTALVGLSYSERIGHDIRTANLLANLGKAYLGTSHYTLALDTYRRALALSGKHALQALTAQIVGQMGIAYKELTDYTAALENFHKALILMEELGDQSGVATNTINIAIVHQAFGDHQRALESFQSALGMFDALGDKSAVAFTLSSIGGLYFRINDFPQALELLGRALAMQVELGEKRDAAVARGNMGHAYKSIGDYDKALEYLQQAYQESVEIGAVYPQLHWLNGLGDLFGEQDFAGYSPEIAADYLLRAIDLSTAHGIRSVTLAAYQSLDALYRKTQNWEMAYQARDRYEQEKEHINIEGAQRLAATREYERKEAEREKQLAIERTRAQEKESILNNILPEEITTRLIGGENPIADYFDSVSILFMDIVDFTRLSASISAQQLVHFLNAIFKVADGIMREFGLEKIKTIGDAYMAVAGAPVSRQDHAVQAAQAALRLLDAMNTLEVSFPKELGDQSMLAALPEINVRIGLHCGSAAAGVVGETKFLYDLWGDAVNTASRMESHGEPGKIHVSEEFTRALTIGTGHDLSQLPIQCIPRGEVEIKGKGMMKTYFLERLDGNG
ncbi:MAG: adenylate/guanylate cyclase domain-containing protein [Candidatus Kapaibacterium sp.]